MGGPSVPAAPPTPTSYGGQPNYIPTGQPSVDQTYQNLLSSLSSGAAGLSGSVVPGAQQYVGNIESNPYAASVMPAALQASSIGTGTLAPSMISSGMSLATGAVPYASQIMAQGFDPQSALYNQNFNNTMQQSNAINAMNGVAGTPYGAGLQTQAASNFNINWNAQQIQNELNASQGYGSLTNSIGSGYNLAGTGLQGLTASASVPYNTYNSMQGNDLSALGTLNQLTSGAYSPTSSALSSAGNYLGLGNQASSQLNNAVSNAYANQLAAYNAEASQYNNMLGGLGSLVGSGFDVASNPLTLFGNSIW